MPTLTRFFLPCALLFAVFAAGCDSTDESGLATFNGQVVDSDGDPIADATVFAEDYGVSAETNAQGAYSFSIEVDSSRQQINLSIFATDYIETDRTVLAFVDQDTRIPDIELQRRGGTNGGSNGGNNGGGNNGGGNGEPGGIDGGADEPSGPAASITLVGRSSQAIGVQSAGADETATLTFIVLDAFGNPIDSEHAVDVTFTIANGPGEGEFLAPATKSTDGSGQVQTTISSGTKSGTVQVFATATNEEGTVITSYPVVITITGGLPDQMHFSVVSERRNFAGYDFFGDINPVTAFVGDIYGNPVQPGTAVYFTTDGGIVEGSGTTDDLGRARVELVSAAPQPSGSFECIDESGTPYMRASEGYAIVEALTSNRVQDDILTTTTVLFSGETQITFTDVDADPDNGDLGNYGFRVSDRFGNPLEEGTTISVTADGVNVEAVGDEQVTLGDHLCPGDGRTDFLISVVQGDEVGEDDLPLPPQLETLTIKVNSPNGNAQLTVYNTGGRPEIVFERID